MKILRPILSLACLFIAISGFSQSNPWRKIVVPVLPELSYKLDAYQTFELDETALKSSLMEIVGGTHSKELQLPMPDGSFEAFTVVESSIMMPGLQARYPQIRCFAGQSRLDSRIQVRMGIDDNGFYALFIGPKGQSIITKLDGSNYVSFWKKDKISNFEGKVSTCGATHEQELEAVIQDKIDRKKVPSRVFPTSQVDEKTYRIAIATTGEFAVAHGGTYSSVSAYIVKIMNMVNAVTHNDWAVKFVIAENNDSLINFDALTDPYTNGIAGAMINENNTFIPTKIPLNSYDIGHVFGTVSVSGVVGLAELYSLCKTNSKGRGISNQPTWATGDDNYFSTSLVAHELGHQFGCAHTFNNCDGN
ncbi:MAG: zinc-dependent metalloprotease family protein, partial [Saprospiraceae bacterium]